MCKMDIEKLLTFVNAAGLTGQRRSELVASLQQRKERLDEALKAINQALAALGEEGR